MNQKAGIVTGGASGIGKAIVERLLSDGAKVYAIDRDVAALDRLKAAHSNDALICVAGDVTTPDFAKEITGRCVSESGAVDFLVAAAGVMHPPGALHELSVEDYDRVQSVNMKGCFLFHGAVASAMLAGGTKGAIVNIASTAAIRPVPMAGGYVTSKHAMAGFTTTAAVELAPSGIRVNAVCPGVTDTPLFRTNAAGGPAEAMVDMIPIRRIARSSEVANAVVWLLSDQASYVTGVVMPVDGGLSLI